MYLLAHPHSRETWQGKPLGLRKHRIVHKHAHSTKSELHECTNQVRGGGGYTSGTKSMG